MSFDAHAIEKQELLERLSTDAEKGLSESEVQKRLQKYGKNSISKHKHLGNLAILIKQFKNPLVIILIVAIFLSAFFASFVDALIIFAALLINILIGFAQEKKAGRIFETLAKQLEDKISVLREGAQTLIDSKDLTVGDIVFLEAGKKVPADMRVLDVTHLKVDESALTGESLPVEKRDCICKNDTPLNERENMLYAGTLVVDGQASAVVVSVGSSTEFGRIASSAQHDQEQNTPLQKKVAKLSKIIAITLLVISAVIVTLAAIQGVPTSDLLLLVIALAVASVPEGLPAAIAVVLAVAMERILKKGGLVKYPAAAEALGSVDFILTDKTGTLTSGNMTLTHILPYECLNQCDKESKDALETLKAASLASDAFLEEKDGEEKIHGRPIEKAIISRALKEGIRQDELFASSFVRVDFIPFASSRRFAVSLNKDPHFESVAYLSGAPETLIELSKFVLSGGSSILFSDKMKQEFLLKQEELSLQSFRLTAVAKVPIDSLEKFKSGNYKDLPIVFMGFLVFEDEVRDSATEAVKDAQNMGVKVLMLTGDNQNTALAIAQKTGIASNENQLIVGTEYEKLSDKEILQMLTRKSDPVRIFARMLPAQKRRLVLILQKNGYSVSMTGDGINDAPALALANIGVAVESGTDVAKEAADMILLKNSFASISFAIKDGRRALVNIYKTIVYMLSTSVSETILLGVALSFGGPLPLLPSQLLWHNLIEGGLMNFPFAFDKASKDARAFSRKKKEFERKNYLFAAYLAILFSSLLLFTYIFMLYFNYSIDSIRTVLFVTFSTSGFFLALSFRDLFKPIWLSNPFSNKFLNIALAVNLFLLLIAFSFEPLRDILGLKIPNMIELKIVLFIALIKWIGIELLKYLLFIRK